MQQLAKIPDNITIFDHVMFYLFIYLLSFIWDDRPQKVSTITREPEVTTGRESLI